MGIQHSGDSRARADGRVSQPRERTTSTRVRQVPHEPDPRGCHGPQVLRAPDDIGVHAATRAVGTLRLRGACPPNALGRNAIVLTGHVQ